MVKVLEYKYRVDVQMSRHEAKQLGFVLGKAVADNRELRKDTALVELAHALLGTKQEIIIEI